MVDFVFYLSSSLNALLLESVYAYSIVFGTMTSFFVSFSRYLFFLLLVFAAHMRLCNYVLYKSAVDIDININIMVSSEHLRFDF